MLRPRDLEKKIENMAFWPRSPTCVSWPPGNYPNGARSLARKCPAQATQQLKAEEQAQQDAAQAANVDAVLRRHLTPDARARLARIALVEPKRAASIKADLAAMAEQGGFVSPMSDAALKQVLAQLSKSRSNASVRRI